MLIWTNFEFRANLDEFRGVEFLYLKASNYCNILSLSLSPLKPSTSIVGFSMRRLVTYVIYVRLLRNLRYEILVCTSYSLLQS